LRLLHPSGSQSHNWRAFAKRADLKVAFAMRFNSNYNMSHKYKVIDQTQPTFITITVIGWVDVFIRLEYFRILDASLNYCTKNKGLNVHAYIYMSSHIHLIVTSQREELEDFIRGFKKFTSRRIIEAIKESPESRREWLLKKFSFAAKRIR
jgi:REP element-mobilizing transposase RayT